MTLESKLRALVAHWKAESKRIKEMADKERGKASKDSLMAQSVRYWMCADELEALLAERQPVCLLCGVPADECTNSLHREAEAHQPSQPALAERQEPPTPREIECKVILSLMGNEPYLGKGHVEGGEFRWTVVADRSAVEALAAAPSSGTGESK